MNSPHGTHFGCTTTSIINKVLKKNDKCSSTSYYSFTTTVSSNHARAKRKLWARIARRDKGAIMMGCFVTRIGPYIKAKDPICPIYDILEGGKSTRIDIDVMHHMKIVEKIGDMFRLVRHTVAEDDDSNNEEGDDNNMEEGIPHTSLGLGTFSGASIAGAGSSFQPTSKMSNEEVLTCIILRWTCLMLAFRRRKP
ncbi:hypothetical protein JCGZ_05210 [Jatropha curcas]|uniref:Uncharacterized protein n=1 Tax=Jatropha curcas TaxID=180498 RepID=A0A067KZS7_JATCU|nr:hypothetical protein JCGZ_05210 [Jatropha curcas]